jgi:hypothetical protein
VKGKVTGMRKMLSERSVVRAVRDQVSSDLGGEAVILGLTSGVYYGLDTVGTFVWNLLQEPRTIASLRDAILEEYDVEPDRCEQDLLALLERLRDENLVEVVDA